MHIISPLIIFKLFAHHCFPWGVVREKLREERMCGKRENVLLFSCFLFHRSRGSMNSLVSSHLVTLWLFCNGGACFIPPSFASQLLYIRDGGWSIRAFASTCLRTDVTYSRRYVSHAPPQTQALTLNANTSHLPLLFLFNRTECNTAWLHSFLLPTMRLFGLPYSCFE